MKLSRGGHSKPTGQRPRNVVIGGKEDEMTALRTSKTAAKSGEM